MNDPRSGFDFSFLVPALTAGLKDSVNPYTLTIVLVLCACLSFVGTTAKRVFFLGLIFVLSAIGTYITALRGYWDRLLTNLNVLGGIHIAYLVLAGIFVVVGIVEILDWWGYKKSSNLNSFRLRIPKFFEEQSGSQTKNLKRKIIYLTSIASLTVLIAATVTLMASTYPQNEYMFVVHSYGASGGDQGFVYQSFTLYSIAMVLLVISAWLIICWLTLKKKQSHKAILYYKIVLSALFLSTGFSLGNLILK